MRKVLKITIHNKYKLLDNKEIEITNVGYNEKKEYGYGVDLDCGSKFYTLKDFKEEQWQ